MQIQTLTEGHKLLELSPATAWNRVVRWYVYIVLYYKKTFHVWRQLKIPIKIDETLIFFVYIWISNKAYKLFGWNQGNSDQYINILGIYT